MSMCDSHRLHTPPLSFVTQALLLLQGQATPVFTLHTCTSPAGCTGTFALDAAHHTCTLGGIAVPHLSPLALQSSLASFLALANANRALDALALRLTGMERAAASFSGGNSSSSSSSSRTHSSVQYGPVCEAFGSAAHAVVRLWHRVVTELAADHAHPGAAKRPLTVLQLLSVVQPWESVIHDTLESLLVAMPEWRCDCHRTGDAAAAAPPPGALDACQRAGLLLSALHRRVQTVSLVQQAPSDCIGEEQGLEGAGGHSLGRHSTATSGVFTGWVMPEYPQAAATVHEGVDAMFAPRAADPRHPDALRIALWLFLCALNQLLRHMDAWMCVPVSVPLLGCCVRACAQLTQACVWVCLLVPTGLKVACATPTRNSLSKRHKVG